MILGEQYLINIDEEREKQEQNMAKQYKKPKVRISRLSQEKMQVPIELDIPINENLTIKERFDWNMSEMNISPTDYISIFCERLRLSDEYRDRMVNQLLTQLLDYIDKNTRIKRRNEDNSNTMNITNHIFDDDEQNKERKLILFYQQEIQNLEEENKTLDKSTPYDQYYMEEEILQKRDEQTPSNAINGHALGAYQSFEDQQNPHQETRRTSRQRRLEELKKAVTPISNVQVKSTYYRDKKPCKICEYINITPINRCKKCKCPFDLVDELNLEDESQKIACQYYSGCVNFRPFLIQEFDENELQVEDFSSTFNLLNIFIEKIKAIPGLKKSETNNLLIFVKSVYKHFKDNTWEEESLRLEELQQIEREQLKQLRKEKLLQQQELQQLKREQIQREKEKEREQQQLLKQQQRDQMDSDTSDEEVDERGKKLIRKGIKKRGRPPKREEQEEEDDDDDDDEEEEIQQIKEKEIRESRNSTQRRGRPRRTD